MIIYKVTNLITSEIYIGKTIRSLETRKQEHLWSVKLDFKSRFHLDLKKYFNI